MNSQEDLEVMARESFRHARETQKQKEPVIVKEKSMVSAGQYYPTLQSGIIFYRKTIPYKARLSNIVVYVGFIELPEAELIISVKEGDKVTTYTETVLKGLNKLPGIKVDADAIVTAQFSYNEHITPEGVEISFLITRL